MTAGPTPKVSAPMRAVAALLLFCLIAGSCAGASVSPDPGDSGSADSAGGVASGSVDDYRQLADSCEPNMQRALDAWADQGYAGSIAVLGDQRQCAIGIGEADRSTGRPVTATTTFSIGSITKAVTAAAVLDLADQGVIGLDDRAGQHVAGLSGPVNDLTIENLLIHSSGLTGYHGRDHVALTEGQAIDAISDLEITFEQGRGYSYTNAGYTLLALVVEAVTEQGFRRYVIDEILRDAADRPLGGFWDGEPAAPEPRAVGYLAGGVPGELGDFAGPHWALDGNGGVAMTALEMAAWTRALFTGQILSVEATEKLTSLRKRLPGGESELPGWVELPPQLLGERAILASGGGGSIGHLMDVAWLPDTGRVLVVAQNATSRNVNDLLLNIVDALVVGTGVPTPPAVVEADPATVDRLVGRYGLEDGSVIDIAVDELDDRGLLITAEGPQAMKRLFPVPAGFDGELERHERAALAFANGETAEGAGLRDEFESQFGPIVEVRILATVFLGGLVTYLELELESDDAESEAGLILALELNEQGGSEALALDPEMPNAWFVPQGAGGYLMHGLFPEDPVVVIRPGRDGRGGDGIEIDGPSGITVAADLGGS